MVNDRDAATPGLAADPEAGHGGGVGQAGEVFQTDLGSARATAVELARQAGRLQVRERATLTVHGWKAHANDLVSDVDLTSERLTVVAGSSTASTTGQRGSCVTFTRGNT
jgi:hypothetical protein